MHRVGATSLPSAVLLFAFGHEFLMPISSSECSISARLTDMSSTTITSQGFLQAHRSPYSPWTLRPGLSGARAFAIGGDTDRAERRAAGPDSRSEWPMKRCPRAASNSAKRCHRRCLRLLVEVDRHVAAEDHVKRSRARARRCIRFNSAKRASGHPRPDHHMVGTVRRGPWTAPSPGRDRGESLPRHSSRRVHGPGWPGRHRWPGCGGPAAPRRTGHRQHREGQRIGLLPGRTARRPDPHPLARRAASIRGGSTASRAAAAK